ncbi:hypothetical protein LCGC14_0143540 [marine sediment metagenome]|uniref:Uncharacterized protein n=1 Tax=marine sediment metagenome TaxID=412755 RepID=A0A0F9V0B2_9ZZZZ
MFGNIDKSKGYLFSSFSLQDILTQQTQKLRQEVEALEANRLLNTAPEDLKQYLVQKYYVEPLILRREDWYADTAEVQVDVRYDSRRFIRDTGRPVYAPGERVDVYVPFEGDPELFYAHANQFSSNPPRAVVNKTDLLFRYDSPSDAPLVDVRSSVERVLNEIEQYLALQRAMIQAYNQGLANQSAQCIEQRRTRLLAQSERVAALGIPVRRREDAPKTYAVPTVQKKAAPKLPPASAMPFKPEPTWAMEQYEQALRIMQDMAIVMERSPEAFKSMNEEALRQHFLVQLNGQFEGKATGETFNMSGKTDILLREADRNVFIAECKFWKGPKAFKEAIDQLLGYTTWRDGKTAILVFNRGIDTTTVMNGIDARVKEHPNFKRAVTWSHESGFRYVLRANDDAGRELILTVLIFHVPA